MTNEAMVELELDETSCRVCGAESLFGTTCARCGQASGSSADAAPPTRRDGGFLRRAAPLATDRYDILDAPEQRHRLAVEAERTALAMLEELDGGFEEIARTSRDEDLARLGDLVPELRKHHEAYVAAEASWSAHALADKRAHRLARAHVLERIENVLRWIGDLEVVASLEKMSFTDKIRRLEAYAPRR
jgi:hypothetical protein